LIRGLLGQSEYGECHWTPSMGSFFSLTADDITGTPRDFGEFKDQVVLVVNVASK